MHDSLRTKSTAAPLLRIGRRDDGHERDADRFANGSQHGLPSGTASAHGSLRAAPTIVGDVLRSSGRPLDPDVRALMDARFHHDFGAIRVHDDAHAAAAAQAVCADAFTVGNEIVFGRSRYRPGTEDGRQLIGHELVHSIQQSAGGEPVVQRKTVCDEEGVCWCEMDDEPNETSSGGQCSVESEPAPLDRTSPLVAGAASAAAPLLRPQPLPPSAPVRPPLRVIPGGGGAPSPTRFPTPRLLPISPLAVGIGAAVVTLLWPSETAPPWMDELNPYTFRPYSSPEEYQEVQRRRREEATPGPQQGPQQGPQPQPQPQPQPRRPDQECLELHPYAVTCDPGTMDREQVVRRFLQWEGVTVSNLNCSGVGSFGVGAIDACDGAPGERAHCVVNGNRDRIVSVFGCLCCAADGSTGYSWRGAHWSVNQSRRGGRR